MLKGLCPFKEDMVCTEFYDDNYNPCNNCSTKYDALTEVSSDVAVEKLSEVRRGFIPEQFRER